MKATTYRGALAPLVLAVGAANLSTFFSAQDSSNGTGAVQILEEMVVTARRREEGLQSAPIALSAFSGDSLA